MEKADTVWFRYYGMERVSVSVKIVSGFGAEWPTFDHNLHSAESALSGASESDAASNADVRLGSLTLYLGLSPGRPGRQGWNQITVTA